MIFIRFVLNPIKVLRCSQSIMTQVLRRAATSISTTTHIGSMNLPAGCMTDAHRCINTNAGSDLVKWRYLEQPTQGGFAITPVAEFNLRCRYDLSNATPWAGIAIKRISPLVRTPFHKLLNRSREKKCP